jgi:ribosomal protein S12 methylthiotransferase accessory factor
MNKNKKAFQREMSLSSCIKKYTYGTDKAELPMKTIKNILRRLKSEKIKIRLKNITNYLKTPIPIYRCDVISNSLQIPLLGGNRSWGKGLTNDLAKASALAELIERRTASLYIENKRNIAENCECIYTTYDSLKENKVDINFLVSYSWDKRDRERLKKIIKEKKMVYTKYYSLTEDCWKFLPVEWHVYFHRTNGFAAGNTLEEAVLHGLCEVIERHNTAESQIAEFPIKAISAETIKGKIVRSLIEKFNEEKALIKLFNLTVDIPLSTIYCLFISKNEWGVPRYGGGWGTATNPEIAAIRAINEAALFASARKYTVKKYPLLYLDHYKIGFKFPKLGFLKQERMWTRTLKMGGYNALGDFNFIKYTLLSLVHDKIPMMNLDLENNINLRELPNHENNDFYKEIKKCVQILKKRGYEVLVKNITSRGLDIPTVHIICPGMKFNQYTEVTLPKFAKYS